MPIYEYKCSCGREFEVIHEIEERYSSCENLDPLCEGSGAVQKIYRSFDVNKKVETDNKNKAGTTVNKFIEEVKEDLKEEKKRMKNKIIEVKNGDS